jgi:antitoxin YqcF
MPTLDNKTIAKLTLEAFGGSNQARVFNYLDDNEVLTIPILTCPDMPQPGFTSYATIGLSDYQMFQDNIEFTTRLEIVGVGNSDITWFSNVLSTCAFYVMRSGWLCCPGSVLQDVVRLYSPSSEFRHMYFTSPFYWEDSLKTIQLETKQVSWLLAFPITDEEYQYLKINGDNEFENLLETNDADVFNLNRESVI